MSNSVRVSTVRVPRTESILFKVSAQLGVTQNAVSSVTSVLPTYLIFMFFWTQLSKLAKSELIELANIAVHFDVLSS